MFCSCYTYFKVTVQQNITFFLVREECYYVSLNLTYWILCTHTHTWLIMQLGYMCFILFICLSGSILYD